MGCKVTAISSGSCREKFEIEIDLSANLYINETKESVTKELQELGGVI
jgi:hypothetical protein